MRKTKSQASLEYLMVFGIALAILVVLGSLFLGYFNSEKKSMDISYIQKIGTEMMDNVEKVYFLGYGNRVTIDTKFPEGITNISIIHYNNHNMPDGSVESFDRLSITFIGYQGEVSHMFEPNDLYVRFNCTECIHDHVKNISYYNDSNLAPGFRRIRFESRGDYVAIDFPKD